MRLHVSKTFYNQCKGTLLCVISDTNTKTVIASNYCYSNICDSSQKCLSNVEMCSQLQYHLWLLECDCISIIFILFSAFHVRNFHGLFYMCFEWTFGRRDCFRWLRNLIVQSQCNKSSFRVSWWLRTSQPNFKEYLRCKYRLNFSCPKSISKS